MFMMINEDKVCAAEYIMASRKHCNTRSGGPPLFHHTHQRHAHYRQKDSSLYYVTFKLFVNDILIRTQLKYHRYHSKI